MSSFRPIRVLFGSFGWPCGLLEVASFVKQKNLANVRLTPILPTSPWKIPPELLRAATSFSSERVENDEGIEKSIHAIAELGIPFTRRLLFFRPDVIGLRAEGWCFPQMVRSIEAVRRLMDVTILVGGPTATSSPEEVLLESGADYVFAGEAERSLAAFLEHAAKPFSRSYVAEIDGLTYTHAGKIYTNLIDDNSQPRFSEAEMRATPLDLSLMEGFEGPFDGIYLVGGRGCPGKCTFCARLHGSKVRTKTAAQLIAEMESVDRLCREGKLRIERYRHYRATSSPLLRERRVGWACLYDEDFFLDRDRTLDFFQLFSCHFLKSRYRLNVQTNPSSLLDRSGKIDQELLHWIGRLKPMLQLGGETFHPAMLARWKKGHTVEQLEMVCDALDQLHLDYTVFQILTDYETTAGELLDALRLLVRACARHSRMRPAVSAWMLPLRRSETWRSLEARLGRNLTLGHFLEHEQGHPEWLRPEVALLADFAEARLEDCLELEHRDRALKALFPDLIALICEQRDSRAREREKWEILLQQAFSANEELASIFER